MIVRFKEIAEGLRSGKLVGIIAKENNVCNRTVKKVANSIGWERSWRNKELLKWNRSKPDPQAIYKKRLEDGVKYIDDSNRKKVKRLLKSGRSLREISISEGIIYHIVQKYAQSIGWTVKWRKKWKKPMVIAICGECKKRFKVCIYVYVGRIRYCCKKCRDRSWLRRKRLKLVV